MKYIQSFILSLVAVGIFVIPFAQAEEIEFEVHGMACSFCAYGLEKKIKKLEGVEDVRVNIKTGKAVISTEEGAEINQEEIKKAVKKAGLSMKGDVIVSDESHDHEGSHDHSHHEHGGDKS